MRFMSMQIFSLEKITVYLYSIWKIFGQDNMQMAHFQTDPMIAGDCGAESAPRAHLDARWFPEWTGRQIGALTWG